MEVFGSTYPRSNQFTFDPFLDVFLFDLNSNQPQINQSQNPTSFKKGRYTISRIPTSNLSQIARENNQKRFKILVLPKKKQIETIEELLDVQLFD
jgi:hypothetical protein